METIIIIAKVVGVSFLLFVGFAMWCLCAASSKDSRHEEQMDLQNQTCLLSDNEKQVVDNILRNINEDGVAYIPANGK